MSITEQREY